MRRFKSLAWRNIRSRPVRAGLNTIGIVLGVGLIFAVIALSANLVRTFDRLFDSVYSGVNIVVATENSSGVLPPDTFDKVKSTRGVKDATGQVNSVLVLVKNGKVSKSRKDRIYAGGVDPNALDFRSAKIVEGHDISRGDQIVIDRPFADAHNIKPGQTIAVAAPAGVRKLSVVGVSEFKNNFSFGGQGLAAIPIDAARIAFDIPKGFDEIDVKVAGKSDEIPIVKTRLERELGAGVDVSTPKELGDQIGDSLSAFNVVLGFFAAIAVFVGGFLILNSFAMTIAQRIREIGMLRTMGAGRKQVTRSILRESALLGALGSLVGIGVGLILTRGLVAMVESFGVPFSSVEYPVGAFVVALLIGISATLVAAWQPARKAGRISPMEAVSEEPAADKSRLGRRVVVGIVLMLLGLAGAYAMVTSSSGSAPAVVAGIGGVFALFTGAILVAPAVIPWITWVLAPFVRLGGRLEGRLAVDSVLANRRRSAATASILMVGIAMVATFGSVASSSLATVKQQLNDTFKSDFTVRPIVSDQGGPQSTIAPSVANDIARIPGVAVVSPERMLYLSKGYNDSDTFVRAIDPATRGAVESPQFVGTSAPEAYAGMKAGGVTINENYARSKHIDVGETIKLKALQGVRPVKVVALDSAVSNATVTLTMSLQTARQVYGLAQDSDLAIALKKGANADRTRTAIERALHNYPQLEVSSTAEVKKDIEKQQTQGLSFFYALMIVAVVIGLFGVMNTVFISVMERTREIGVLRAVGARRRQVRKMVRRESIILTVSGAIMGLVVGLILGRVFVYGFTKTVTGSVYALPVGIIVISIILSVVFGVLAAGLPARRAAKTNVVEAVSYE